MKESSIVKVLLMLAVASTTVAFEQYKQASTKDNLQVFIYETETTNGNDGENETPASRMVDQINKLDGASASVFGGGDVFAGFGSKFTAVLPLLKAMPNPDTLVVIADSRDVLVNNPYGTNVYNGVLAEDFKTAYEEVTAGTQGSIIISAEAQCCVSALTHARPGSYYNDDGSRNKSACSSGEAGCLWAGDDKALPWESFMTELMLQRVSTSNENEYEDMYLNSGLITGKAKDLIRIIGKANIKASEDDQAVWTDYMYRHPEDIMLDYGQKVFGNNRGGITGFKVEGCTFTMEKNGDRLIHSKTNTLPLFIHSPGGFYECHDALSQALNIPLVTKTVRRRLKQKERKLDSECNYGRSLCPGNSGGFFNDMLTNRTSTSSGFFAQLFDKRFGGDEPKPEEGKKLGLLQTFLGTRGSD